MRKKIYCLICMMVILCLAVMAAGCSDSTEGETTGEQTPSAEETEFNDLKDFTAVASTGEKIDQSYFADYDVTIVNIWGTYCPPCLEEMPKIAELDKVRPDNIGMILICTDALAEPDYMQEILDDAGFEGINLIRGNGDFADLLNKVQFVPTTIFVDREGNVVGEPVIGESMNPKMTFYKHINKYLEENGLETLSV